MEAVGANLRAKRLDAGLKQEELAAKVGLSTNSISMIELGKREFLASEFARFAQALGVSVADLIPQEPATIAASGPEPKGFT